MSEQDEYAGRDWVLEDWEKLAAYAWENYQNKGRGAVVLDVRKGLRINNVPTPALHYWVQGGQQIPQLGKDIEELVESYDPDGGFVLGVLTPPEKVMINFAPTPEGRLSPKKAYEQGHKVTHLDIDVSNIPDIEVH
jgi:hypothetical protein